MEVRCRTNGCSLAVRWLLLAAVVVGAGCSIDASKLRSPAQVDGRVQADRPDDLRSAPDASDDVYPPADVPGHEAEVNDVDAAQAVDPSPDAAFDGARDAPPDELSATLDALKSEDLIQSIDGAIAPMDTRAIDSDNSGDVPYSADRGADSFEDNPADASVDVKDSAALPDTADAAPTCGGAGQTCCAGNACLGGGCCVGGSCAASGSTCPSPLAGTCLNGACGTCGGSNGTCCVNSSCTAANTICQTSTFPTTTTCTSCGGSGETCCPGNSCLNGGCCIASISGGNATCKSVGLQCSPGITTICSANTCGTCGGLGNPCCANNRCTAPNTFCQTTPAPATCAACGGASQPCCPNPIAGGSVTCSPGFACQNGTGGQASCMACGGPNQPCCSGYACTTGSCRSGTCS